MELEPDEPAVTAWERLTDVELVHRLRGMLPGSGGLLLIDGRSGAGKSTWATRLGRLLDSPVMNTDDVAWHHDPFDWDQLLLDHVIAPWRRKEQVAYVPPGWPPHGRSGAIEVPASDTLVIEGVGACRASLAAHAELTIWVQSDRSVARRLGIARDAAAGRTWEEAVEFWDWWMSVEDPFQVQSRPWSRARLIVRGTCDEPAVPAESMIAPGPIGPDSPDDLTPAHRSAAERRHP